MLCGLLVSLAFPPSSAMGQSAAYVGVPVVDPDYQGDVRKWWSAHPLNPRAAGGAKKIPSPVPQVRIASGGSIQEAIDRLPASGGTIVLEPGRYDAFRIVGRSHVHVLGPASGEAIITGHSYLANGPETMDYPAYDAAVSNFDNYKYKDKRLWEQYQRPVGNFVLRNLVFDGEGKTTVDFPGVGIQGPGGAIGLKRVRDVLIEHCVFRNFLDTSTGLQHCGPAWGHYGLTNIWFRDCTFLGAAKYAVYLDGAHGSGFVGCTFDGKGCKQGGLLFLANHDFTDDLDENGKIDAPEEKCAKFVVISGCTFNWAGQTPIRFTGRDLLLEGNQFSGLMIEVVGVYPVGEVAHRSWPAGHLKIHLVDNTVGQCARAVLTIFDRDRAAVEQLRQVPVELQYSLENNRVGKTPVDVVYSPLRQ